MVDKKDTNVDIKLKLDKVEYSKAFKQLEKESLKSAGEVEKNNNKLSASFTKLRTSVNLLAKSLSRAFSVSLVGNVSKVVSELRSLNVGFNAVAQSTKKARQEFGLVKKNISDLKLKNLVKELEKVKSQLAKLKRESDETSSKVKNNNKSKISSFRRLGNAITNVKTLLGGFIATSFLNSVVRAGAELESLSNSFELVFGSAEKARQEMDFAESIANRLGFEVNGLSQSYLKLAAASKGTVLEGQATRNIFQSVSETMRSLGRNSEQLNGAMTAVEQIISKGKVSAEELRGQLGERLPGAFQIAARSMGVTTQQLDKLLEQGKLQAVDFLPKFAEQLATEFQISEKQTKSLSAAIGRFGNQLTKIKQDFFNGGFGEGFTVALSNISEALGKINLKPITRLLGGLVEIVSEAILVIAKFTDSALGGIVLRGGVAAGILLALSRALVVVRGSAITTMFTIGGLKAAFIGLFTILKANPFIAITSALVALLPLIDEWLNITGNQTRAEKKLAKQVKETQKRIQEETAEVLRNKDASDKVRKAKLEESKERLKNSLSIQQENLALQRQAKLNKIAELEEYNQEGYLNRYGERVRRGDDEGQRFFTGISKDLKILQGELDLINSQSEGVFNKLEALRTGNLNTLSGDGDGAGKGDSKPDGDGKKPTKDEEFRALSFEDQLKALQTFLDAKAEKIKANEELITSIKQETGLARAEVVEGLKALGVDMSDITEGSLADQVELETKKYELGQQSFKQYLDGLNNIIAKSGEDRGKVIEDLKAQGVPLPAIEALSDEAFESDMAKLTEQNEFKLLTYEEQLIAINELEAKYGNLSVEQKKKNEQTKNDIEQKGIQGRLKGAFDEAKSKLSIAQSVVNAAQSLGIKSAGAQKAISYTNALVNTFEGISKAVASAPFPANVPAIAFATSTGFAQVASIASQKAPSPISLGNFTIPDPTKTPSKGFRAGGTTPVNEAFMVGEEGREIIAPQAQALRVLNNTQTERAVDAASGVNNATINLHNMIELDGQVVAEFVRTENTKLNRANI